MPHVAKLINHIRVRICESAYLVIAGTAFVVEIACAPINQPTAVEKVVAAAKEFAVKIREWVVEMHSRVGRPTGTQLTGSSLSLKESSGNAFEEAFIQLTK